MKGRGEGEKEEEEEEYLVLEPNEINLRDNSSVVTAAAADDDQDSCLKEEEKEEEEKEKKMKIAEKPLDMNAAIVATTTGKNADNTQQFQQPQPQPQRQQQTTVVQPDGVGGSEFYAGCGGCQIIPSPIVPYYPPPPAQDPTRCNIWPPLPPVGGVPLEYDHNHGNHYNYDGYPTDHSSLPPLPAVGEIPLGF